MVRAAWTRSLVRKGEEAAWCVLSARGAGRDHRLAKDKMDAILPPVRRPVPRGRVLLAVIGIYSPPRSFLFSVSFYVRRQQDYKQLLLYSALRVSCPAPIVVLKP